MSLNDDELPTLEDTLTPATAFLYENLLPSRRRVQERVVSADGELDNAVAVPLVAELQETYGVREPGA